MYAVEVKMEAVLVDGVFAGNLALSNEQCSAEMLVRLPHRDSEEVQLAGYI